MFARFDENPAMTLRVIKETKRYGLTDGRTHGRTDAGMDNVKTVYPLQTKFAGGINMHACSDDALMLQQRLLLVYKVNTCSDTLVIGYIRKSPISRK